MATFVAYLPGTVLAPSASSLFLLRTVQWKVIYLIRSLPDARVDRKRITAPCMTFFPRT